MFTDTVIAGSEICPRCETAKLKSWDELSEDEKFFTRYFSAAAEFSREECKRHLFCMKCRYESIGETEIDA